MGLDMYLYASSKIQPHETDSGALQNEDEAAIDLYYWRKFNALHGWMEKLYRAKGGTDGFNCVNLQLTVEDLVALENACNNKELVPVSGFFFGSQAAVTDEEYADVHNAIKTAREAIKDGLTVYYSSWW